MVSDGPQARLGTLTVETLRATELQRSEAESRADLRRKLSVQSGGVVFTTIQKFYPGEQGDTCPTLSERRNVVVIADEAHRSQYDFIDGYARHIRDALPNASFIGFTGFDAPNLRNVGIDRPLRENARANLRRMVRRTLNRHGYPPARQEQAIRTVVEQAELFPENLPG